MSSVDCFEKPLPPTLCEWKAGKEKRESAWQTLLPKKALLWCPRKKNQRQKTKQRHDYCITSLGRNGNGWVAFRIWGSTLRYHFRPFVSAFHSVVFILTEALAHCKSFPQASSSQRWSRNWNGRKRQSDKIRTWTINPGSCVMSLTFPPSLETTLVKCWCNTWSWWEEGVCFQKRFVGLPGPSKQEAAATSVISGGRTLSVPIYPKRGAW